MNSQSPLVGIPRAAIQGIANGIILMAFFTVLWASWAAVGVSIGFRIVIGVVFFAFAIVFLVEGIPPFGASKRLPTVAAGDQQQRSKSIGRRFGVIFATEGILIGASSAVLGATDNYLYINPVTALIVGAHFLPLARVFNRTIDYYIGAWVILVALLGLGQLLSSAVDPYLVLTIVSIGTAAGTSTYGFYMVTKKRALLRRLGSGLTYA